MSTYFYQNKGASGGAAFQLRLKWSAIYQNAGGRMEDFVFSSFSTIDTSYFVC
jgi:hypothetical protein